MVKYSGVTVTAYQKKSFQITGRMAKGYAIMTHDIENFREAHIYRREHIQE